MDEGQTLCSSSWMGNLSDDVRSAPLCLLSIPGSHNSFTYSLERSSHAGPDQPGFVKSLIKGFPGTSSKVLYKWSVTQAKNVKEQLELGVRYFDIRLQCIQGEFRILHCLLGMKIAEILPEIKAFVTENPTEVVILDFQHLYDFQDEDHENLVKLILEEFGDLLCSWQQDILQITLCGLQVDNTRIIVIYPVAYYKKNEELRNRLTTPVLYKLWPRKLFPNPWPDTAKANRLATFLSEKFEAKKPDEFFISQGILTPNWKTIIFHPLEDLRSVCVKACNSTVHQWLDKMKEANKRPNIVMVDYVGTEFSCDVVNTVIKFNHSA